MKRVLFGLALLTSLPTVASISYDCTLTASSDYFQSRRRYEASRYEGDTLTMQIQNGKNITVSYDGADLVCRSEALTPVRESYRKVYAYSDISIDKIMPLDFTTCSYPDNLDKEFLYLFAGNVEGEEKFYISVKDDSSSRASYSSSMICDITE